MWYDLYGTSFVRLGVPCGIMDKWIFTISGFNAQEDVLRYYHTIYSGIIIYVKTL